MRRMVLSSVFVAAVSVLASGSGTRAAAPAVTFTRDVAPILHAKCASCHRPGEVAPMPLRTFEEARPYARSIKEKVVNRSMPPWGADRGVGRFSNDPSLTPAQVQTVSDWVDAGAPQGDPKDMPALPAFTDGWQLGEPDLVVELPEVQIPATGGDIFPTPNISIPLKEDRWIRAVEVRPGNRQVTHHTVIFASAAINPMMINIDNPVDLSGLFNVLAVWAVGTPATVYPEGMGRWLRKGQMLRTNLHYHPNGTPQTDRTKVGFYFGKGELKKEVAAALAGNMSFTIPANAPNHELRGYYIVDQDITVVSLFPHMHLRGKDMKMTATYPDGRRETLLNVPAYDFNWQLFYYPSQRISLPRGTQVELVSHYDNSATNRHNPDPARRVTFGEDSNSEMMFGMFEFIADTGVSPKPISELTRMEALLDTLPAGSAFLVDLPFGKVPTPAVVSLPKNGEPLVYLPNIGMTTVQRVQELAWNGSDFQFQSAFMVQGAAGGFYNVTGHVADDGSVRGELRRRGNGLPPMYEFTGRARR